MTTKSIPYLQAPYVNRPVISTEKNYQKVAVCTIALGVLSYYSPKTFYITSAALLGYAIWKFSPMVNQNRDAEAADIRKWVINTCSVGTSVGIIFMFRSVLCFGSAAKAIRHFHIMRTGGNLIAGLFTGCIGIGLYHFTQQRAQELLKTAHWEQMEDYLHTFTGDWRNNFHSLGGKIAFFVSAFFPKITPDNTDIMSQFRSNEDKKTIVTSYLKHRDVIPAATDRSFRGRWVVAIHYFQGLSFWDQETLMPELVRIGRKSHQRDIDELPSDLKDRLKLPMENYQIGMPLPETELKLVLGSYAIPEVGTNGWEIWVKGINEFRRSEGFVQQSVLVDLRRIVANSRKELIALLPEPVRSQLSPPGSTF